MRALYAKHYIIQSLCIYAVPNAVNIEKNTCWQTKLMVSQVGSSKQMGIKLVLQYMHHQEFCTQKIPQGNTTKQSAE